MSELKKITIEEYRFDWSPDPLHRDDYQFVIRYIKHNGYTIMKIENYLTDDFVQWFHLHLITLGTRYNKPHWYHPIHFRRKQRLEKWAIGAITQAYEIYEKEDKE